MPYVENFDLFLQQAEALYRRDPLNVRAQPGREGRLRESLLW